MSWVAVCRRSDIPQGRGWPVRVQGRDIAVFDVDGVLRAVDNRCGHVGNPLDDAAVSGGVLTCPWHGWRYDVRTGDHLTAFGRRPGLRTYPVQAQGDDVLIDLA